MAIAGTALLLTAALPLAASQTTASERPPLGMTASDARALADAGAPPRFGSFWVGPWMAQHGWGGLDNALKTSVAQGVTPVVYWYYWGDSITPSCVESGCDGRSQTQWREMTNELADRVRAHMAGKPTIIVLENEFNKGGITGTYAPTFDAKLEEVAKVLKAVPGVQIALGYGAWAENDWSKFPRALAQSDYVGFQMMRGSTRDTEETYRGAADRVAYLSKFVTDRFQKPSFLYDVALSSYPDAHWERVQAETLQAIFDVLNQAGSYGLKGVVYRSMRDHYMDPSNYFGHAESHWGLTRSDGTPKLAWDVWKREASGPAAPAGQPNVPGSFEAEAMTVTAGGRHADAAASGGAAWNLWSNGEVRQGLVLGEPATLRVTAVAMGQSAGGVDARMELRVNGSAVAAFTVAPGAFRPYVAEVARGAGPATLSVAFTNDAIVGTEDRNLVVDVVRVEIAPPNQPPTASFAATASDLTVSVDASASRDPEGAPLSYAWSFGDGATATGARATHSYAAPGEYVVGLTVSDGKDSASASRTVRAEKPNAAPAAAFDAAMADLRGAFDASASSDPDGDALTYAWSFGDGANATGVRATRDYAHAGEYVVTLTVSDGKASTSATRTVRAVKPNSPPIANFSASTEALAAAFDATGSSDPDGDGLSYAWDFGDGATGSGLRATHAYAKPGTYAVTLAAGDGKATTSVTRQVTVTYPAPHAAFSVGGGGRAFSFDASASRDPAGGPLTYAWTFGDGTTASGATATRTYAGPGAYTVTLEVANRFGGVAAHSAVVTVEPYKAAFSPEGRGNTWWVQTAVVANERTAAVCASVNGGACQPLKLQWWGEWAASFHVPTGARVVFTATSETGQKVVSPAYSWPTGTPFMTASFAPSGNVWWVQASVAASKEVASVCASVDGGACQPLQLQSWGDWAASMHVKKSARVTFTAVAKTGESVASPAYAWPPPK